MRRHCSPNHSVHGAPGQNAASQREALVSISKVEKRSERSTWRIRSVIDEEIASRENNNVATTITNPSRQEVAFEDLNPSLKLTSLGQHQINDV